MNIHNLHRTMTLLSELTFNVRAPHYLLIPYSVATFITTTPKQPGTCSDISTWLLVGNLSISPGRKYLFLSLEYTKKNPRGQGNTFYKPSIFDSPTRSSSIFFYTLSSSHLSSLPCLRLSVNGTVCDSYRKNKFISAYQRMRWECGRGYRYTEK